MRTKPRYFAILLFLLVITFTFLRCKNGENGSGGFLVGGDSFTPATAEEIESTMNRIREMKLFSPELVKEFYRDREYQPAWTVSENRESLFDALGAAEAEGLSGQDYHRQRIQDILQKEDIETDNHHVLLEMMMTDAFLRYAKDLYYGKVNPKDLYSLWGIVREDLHPEGLLQKSLATRNIEQVLDSLKPQHEIYTGLKESLKEYREFKAKDSNTVEVPEGEPLEPGQVDSRTSALAARLKQLGYLENGYTQKDSLYNDSLELAVQRFQKDNGLEVDGVVGSSSLKKLNEGYSDLYDKILVNLERWRWYPRELGEHYILVNIADFKLAVVKNGDTIRQHNVIAGSKQRQTPIFTDTLEYIVINPQWNIPPTIEREDVIPKARNNPAYLNNNNMFVTGPDGESVDPNSIDWSSEDLERYRFTQRAGATNPLGRVKIIYPNQYIIYLHDTPAKALFNREDRAESSGCVRVEGAIDLAAYVVENQDDWGLEQLESTIASGETKQVKITRPIQVHHLYWTAWRGRDKTYFSDDVYDLDQEVLTALTAD